MALSSALCLAQGWANSLTGGVTVGSKNLTVETWRVEGTHLIGEKHQSSDMSKRWTSVSTEDEEKSGNRPSSSPHGVDLLIEMNKINQ